MVFVICMLILLLRNVYSYEALLIEEQSASVEISAFEKKLDTWASAESASKAEPASAAPVPTSSPSTSSPPAVVAFEVSLFELVCVSI